MRTGELTLNGEKYTLAMSLGVLMQYEEDGRDAQTVLTEIMSNGRLTDVVILLQRLIEAGKNYDELNGRIGKTLTLEQLQFLIGPEDLGALSEAIGVTVKKGSETHIETATETKRDTKKGTSK